AAELAPDSGKVLANLALLLLVEGEPARAQQVMDRAKLGDEARIAQVAQDARVHRRQLGGAREIIGRLVELAARTGDQPEPVP
ncbi:hypothetical protein L7A49_33170, partial [Achromobacter xylosoxidans]|nr:hypothetical protein [Achromobacter xylosoxidans]